MNLLDGITGFFALPAVRAALLAALAFVVATVARVLVRRVVSGTRAGSALDRLGETSEAKAGTAQHYAGQLAFLAVLLLFVPGIINTLGIGSSATPILSILDTIWGYVPNVLAAGAILVIGMTVAKVARQLAAPLFERLRVDALQQRAGIESRGDARLSGALATAVYALIAIPVVIMALQALGISAITEPAVDMLDQVLTFVPKVAVAALMVGVGAFVARIAAQVVQGLLASTGVDARVAEATDNNLRDLTVSGMVAGAVRVVVNVFFVVEAFEVVQLGVLTGIGTAVIAYLPSVVAALAIGLVALIAATAGAKALRAAGLGALALPAQAAVAAVAGFMVLSQLGIAPMIVNTAFIALVAAAGAAGALAFGLGGREAAAKALGRVGEGAEQVAGNVREAAQATDGDTAASIAMEMPGAGGEATVVGQPSSEVSSHDVAEKGWDVEEELAGDEGEGTDASREAWNPGFVGQHDSAVAVDGWGATHTGVDTASHSGS